MRLLGLRPLTGSDDLKTGLRLKFEKKGVLFSWGGHFFFFNPIPSLWALATSFSLFFPNLCYLAIHFFYKQRHFRVEPRVAIKIPKMRLKVAMKLLSIFGIEAHGCLVV